jgi:hypothetical protein
LVAENLRCAVARGDRGVPITALHQAAICPGDVVCQHPVVAVLGWR